MLMPIKQLNFVRQFLKGEFLRYLVSGSIAFICDFSVLVFCTEVLGAHYLSSNIAGYTVGFLLSYTINTKWVFDHRDSMTIGAGSSPTSPLSFWQASASASW